MIFQATLNLDNDAFQGENCEYEIAAILRRLADKVEEGAALTPGILRDTNGGTVGTYGFYVNNAPRGDYVTNTEADAGKYEAGRR